MIQFDRQQKILKYLTDRQSATVKELSLLVYASEASVRRDIEALEKEGLLSISPGRVMEMVRLEMGRSKPDSSGIF